MHSLIEATNICQFPFVLAAILNLHIRYLHNEEEDIRNEFLDPQNPKFDVLHDLVPLIVAEIRY